MNDTSKTRTCTVDEAAKQLGIGRNHAGPVRAVTFRPSESVSVSWCLRQRSIGCSMVTW